MLARAEQFGELIQHDQTLTVLTGGMAAALPYCDAFRSGHSLEAMQEVAETIAARRQ